MQAEIEDRIRTTIIAESNKEAVTKGTMMGMIQIVQVRRSEERSDELGMRSAT